MPQDWSTERSPDPGAGVDLHLELDPATGRRAGLEHALRAAIRDGRLAPGARLPATRRLAVELGLARNTVAAAYDQLVAEGYLTARRGAGTQVAALTRPRTNAPTPGRDATAPRFDLRPGNPDVTAFPTADWLRSARRALTSAPAEAHGYSDPRGRIELRRALAGYLGRTRGVQADPAHIVITAGYVQGLSLLAGVLDGPVAMEDPGLAFHREVVRRAGREVVPLPVDGDGAHSLPDVAAAVVTPAHQYPTGVTLHPARRHALVAWARATGAVVVEDDYDGEYRYDRQPVGAVQGTAPDHVVYAGSVSKTLGPGVRLGWLVLPPRLVDPVADAKRHADHQTEALGQLTLADLITGHGYDRHIRASRLRYRRRRDLLVDCLREHTAHGVSAGLHALVHHPDEQAATAAAAEHGLAFGRLGDHHHQRDPAAPQGLIIGYGTPAEHAYRPALHALARVLAARP
ncbi:PLP-dependent aminotransferase family protein [Actinosynnema sp. NPDC047251]|uniref:Transcriptional regulator, GntR family n=1 Tax=Saccharothrix espanaensis (strain ATCC 51144 / DSM 44229 / JCM 9112 / NBRC 15066 / NRRL 15764) TaxID=1179773 RepID=K0K1N4_SACES|nr:PLP-dependent aminotransferase family protein [Saccharothrix espanaensis]CCH31482.1 Transcriptional regulator, GntR family [Saccharothrix espanaensis DSM 44229]